MELTQKKRRRLVGLKHKLLQQARTFERLGRAFLQKGDADLALLSAELSVLCRLLARHTKQAKEG